MWILSRSHGCEVMVKSLKNKKKIISKYFSWDEALAITGDITFPQLHVCHGRLGNLRHLFSYRSCHGDRSRLWSCCGLGRHWGPLQGGAALGDGWPSIDSILRRFVRRLLGTCHCSSTSDDCTSSLNVGISVHRARRLGVTAIWCLEGIHSKGWSLVTPLIGC